MIKFLQRPNRYSMAFFVLSFFLLNIQVFAQTWTARIDDNWDCEWRVITREQWNRLVEQKRAQNEYALVIFTDALEFGEPVRVIKGTRPQLRGYYYLLGTLSPRTDEARTLQNLTGYSQILTYGNDQTGEYNMVFLNRYGLMIPGVIEIDSDKFKNRVMQCERWVNGKTDRLAIIEPESPYMMGKRPFYSWYTSIGSVTTKTKDTDRSFTVTVVMHLGYDQKDEAAYSELSNRQLELREFVHYYFTGKTAAELRPENESRLKQDIREILNTRFLNTAKIRSVVFEKFDVMEVF